MLLLTSVILTSCGVERSRHFKDQEKRFGQDPANDDLPLVPDDEDQSEPTADNDTDENEPPRDLLLSHYGFSGYFDLDTVRRLLRGQGGINGEVSHGGMFDSMLASMLETIVGDSKREQLEMLIREDGVGQNRLTQQGYTEGGDSLAKILNQEGQSGSQILKWDLPKPNSNSSCPDGFICISRMQWVPLRGTAMTYCYRDPVSKEPLSIPYSPNSQFGADFFVDVVGDGITSLPFEVTSHPGTVACTDPELAVMDRRLVLYTIKRGDLTDSRKRNFLRKAIHRRLESDTEISINFYLFHPTQKKPYLPKKGPYIDQLTRLNSKLRFFLDTKQHLIVKLERTVQSPFDMSSDTVFNAIRDTFGSATAYLAQLIFPIGGDTTGAQVVYAFEFCSHLGVVDQAYNHCTGQNTPTIPPTRTP
jgi:hypothetical protein